MEHKIISVPGILEMADGKTPLQNSALRAIARLEEEDDLYGNLKEAIAILKIFARGKVKTTFLSKDGNVLDIKIGTVEGDITIDIPFATPEDPGE